MLLYDPSIPSSLVEFGIQIPISDSRATRTLEALLEDPILQTTQSSWHQTTISERLGRIDLERVHSPNYIERLFSAGLENELLATYELIDSDGTYHRYTPDTATRPITDLFDRIMIKAAATTQVSRLALEHGFAFSFTGGAHHARYDSGSGFCLLNDIVIAARKLQAENLVQNVWIIDVDAHKGDGTALLTRGDDTIRSLSIHMARGWPLDGEAVQSCGTPAPSFLPSDIDLPVESGEENLYLDKLRTGLNQLESFAQAELAIVVCGADPYEHDELPSTALLNLTLEQMFERDRLLYDWLSQRNIPAAFLAAGGYGELVWQVYAQFLKWVLPNRLNKA